MVASIAPPLADPTLHLAQLRAALDRLSDSPLPPPARLALAEAQQALSALEGLHSGGVDQTVFEALLAMAGPQVAPELVAQMAADLRAVEGALAQGLAVLDCDAIRAQTHVLVALAGSAGARSLMQAAQSMNLAAQQGDAVQLRAAGPGLMAGLGHLIRFVEGGATRIGGRKMTASARPPLLLIEDTPSLQMVYRSVLQTAGHRVRVASNAAEGMQAFEESGAVIVLLDLMLPDRDGLTLMRDMLALRADARIIVITANASINRAVEAMRAGAHDFLVKPFDEARFLGAVTNAGGVAQPLAKGAGKRVTVTEPEAAGEVFIGSSGAMRRVQATIRSVAGSMATVFITGESGTGKELCALAVHAGSPRARGPFIALNCGAIPQDLLESEVFGHMKGSFTGAISDKPGAAAAADGGTLFLDEICEMAPALQTKLLRFLQTSTVQPVGAVRPRKVNVRIVCATNRDPAEAVRRGEFREDLYYRLFVVPVHMPPLRERGDDVIEIAETALERFAREEGRRFDGFDPQVLDLFRRLTWPGNVRQVLNVIRNIVVLHPGGRVTLDMLPEFLHREGPVLAPAATQAEGYTLDSLIGHSMAEIERRVIEETIARNGGSVPKAARILELSPSTIYRKLEGWGAKP